MAAVLASTVSVLMVDPPLGDEMGMTRPKRPDHDVLVAVATAAAGYLEAVAPVRPAYEKHYRDLEDARRARAQHPDLDIRVPDTEPPAMTAAFLEFRRAVMAGLAGLVAGRRAHVARVAGLLANSALWGRAMTREAFVTLVCTAVADVADLGKISPKQMVNAAVAAQLDERLERPKRPQQHPEVSRNDARLQAAQHRELLENYQRKADLQRGEWKQQLKRAAVSSKWYVDAARMQAGECVNDPVAFLERVLTPLIEQAAAQYPDADAHEVRRIAFEQLLAEDLPPTARVHYPPKAHPSK